MGLINEKKTEIQDYLVDHPKVRQWSRWIFMFLVEAVSGLVFAYGFRAFIKPTSVCVEYWQKQEIATYGTSAITNADIASPATFISGGASGLSQVILAFVSLFTHVPNATQTMLVSVLYFVINIPLFILSWIKISKQFTVFTIINVGFVSLFQFILPDKWIYMTVNLYTDPIARVIFGGLTTGLSSGLAMIIGTSGGGGDIVSIYISERKSTSVGKYTMALNTAIVLSYVLFSSIGHFVHPEWNTRDTNDIITKTLYTLVYLFITAKVVDIINTKNRKEELQIFTSDVDLPLLLIRSFPHSCTVVESRGAFTGQKNYIVYMVISRSEEKKARKIVSEYDPKAFFTMTDIKQVYGRFYMRSIDD